MICELNGFRQPWVYRLVAGNFDDARPWMENRVSDCEGRLTTLGSVVGTIAKSADGRSVAGKRARIMHRAIARAMEDLAELSDQGTLRL